MVILFQWCEGDGKKQTCPNVSPAAKVPLACLVQPSAYSEPAINIGEIFGDIWDNSDLVGPFFHKINIDDSIT